MARKVRYGVAYIAYGYATTTVPKWLKEHWDELPLPEAADYVVGSDELDLESDIEIYED